METYEDPDQKLQTLCVRCRELDFDKIFRSELIGEGVEVAKIGPKPKNGKRSKCGLCEFFYASSPAYRKKFSLHVRLFNSLYMLPQLRLQLNMIPSPPEPFLGVLRSNPRPRYDYAFEAEIRQAGIIGYIPKERPESCSIRLVSEGIVNYQFITDQLSACTANHVACEEIKSGPTSLTYLKLIDCLEGKIVYGSLSDKYMTLSYVWGKQSKTAAQSTTSNFCLDKSPLTVRDAAQVVVSLEKRFLWVDRHCIDQNDNVERDIMIHNMDSIYEHSEGTIVAIHGENDESGLPGVSKIPRSPQLKVEFEKGILISSCPPITTLIVESKWNTRGWTYQEARLSRRCIFFSEFQVYFVCRQSLTSEAVPFDASISMVTQLLNNSRLDAGLFGKNTSIPNGFHYDRLQYTKRDLTKSEDILDAFRGIVRRSAFVTISGIPVTLLESNLDLNTGFSLGLLWFRRPGWTWNNLPNSDSSLARRRPGFPTWSWTSVFAQIYQDSYGLQSAHGKFVHQLPANFPENEAHIMFAPLIDGNAVPLTVEVVQMIADTKFQGVKGLSVDGEFISLPCRHREPFHERYLIGDTWIYFQPDLWDADREKSRPGARIEADQEVKAEALVLIQWNESQKPSKIRLLLMLVEWVGNNRAERRGLLTQYRNEFPRTVIESLPRKRKKFILQ